MDLVDWFERHPGVKELLMLVLFVGVISASFYAGFHFRTVDNYVCFSYVGVDMKGNVLGTLFSPHCNPGNQSSDLGCGFGDGLFSYNRGVYIGPDPPVKVLNESSNGYLYYGGNLSG